MFFKSKILFSTVFSLSLLTQVSASRYSPDKTTESPENFQERQSLFAVPTKNQKGVQFPTLGHYEETVMSAAKALNTAEIQDPTVLVLGDGYGRFSQEILKRTNPSTNVIVNDLSGDNLRPFMEYLRNADATIRQRTVVDFGNGIDILNRHHSSKLFDETAQSGKVDLLICNNMWHFLDGREILDLYVLMGKVLKPGGQAFLFGHSRNTKLTSREFDTYAHLGYGAQAIAMQSTHTLMSLLEEHNDDSVIFPGLMRFSLITKAHPGLLPVFAQCPNGDVLSNTIPLETHQKLSNMLGFNLDMIGYFSMQSNQAMKKAVCIQEDSGAELGICLTRTEDTLSSRDGIPEEFQDRCDNAFSQNETFITSHIKPAPAPDFLKFES